MRRLMLSSLVFVALFAAAGAHACQCLERTPEHSLEIIQQAELIFEGRIVALDTKEQPEEDFDYAATVPVSQSPLYSKAKLRVLTSYKGAPAGEKVEAYIDILTSCGITVAIGDVTDFVLTRKDEVLVQAGLCDMPDAAGWQTLKAAQLQ